MRFDPSFSERISAFGKRVASLRDEIKDLGTGVLPMAQELSASVEELRTAEEELRTQQEELLLVQGHLDEQRARYQDLFENAPDAYFVTDERGIIREANRAAGAMLGISQQFLAGKPLLHYFEATDIKPLKNLLREIQTQQAARQFTARLIPRGSPILHVQGTLTALRSRAEASAKQVGVRWLIRDASALVKAEMEATARREELARIKAQFEAQLPPDVRAALDAAAQERAAREQAEQTSRMKDQFLALVVHELRNPLTPVMTVLEELLEKKDPQAQTTRETLEMMYRNLVSQSRMIGDLLDVARIIHGKMELRREAVDLAGPLNDAIAGLSEAAAAKRQSLRPELSQEQVAVHGDAVRLRQVFWNLISNAIKFTPTGGEIAVRLHADRDDAYVEVRDTGMGISAAALPQIFNAFEQTESPFARSLGGLGLGLSIVRSLVEAHGGKVEAQSQGEGMGSVFRVRLPRTHAVPKAPEAGNTAARKKSRRLRILVVEDHEDTRKALSSLLTRMGHEVRTAGTVEQAIMETERGRFDLLISDLSLPDGNGRDILTRAPGGHVAFAVACSGWGMPEDVERSRKAGFALHLTKPVSIEQLRDVLSRFAAAG